jgi:hypothetical protein
MIINRWSLPVYVTIIIISFLAGAYTHKHKFTPTSNPIVSVRDTLPPKPDNTLLMAKMQQSEFEIDFKAMNAFSIERSIQDNQTITIIGYRDKEGSIGQWYLSCSEENHKRLAEQFKKDILDK